MTKKNNTNVVFIISQPRAGSTLLQKILANHQEVYTVAEPWFLLPGLYGRGMHNLKIYNSVPYKRLWANNAVEYFLSENFSDENLKTGYSAFYEKLVRNLLEKNGKKYFLDKTPRYYYVIEEISKFFPEAKIIILFRNPIAVLNSILDTWVKKSYFYLNDFKDDMFLAPRILGEFAGKKNPNVMTVQYEMILDNPEDVIKKITQFIGIEFDTKMINYKSSSSAKKFKYGDPKTVDSKSKPDRLHADAWIQKLTDVKRWKLLHDYLIMLGKDRIDLLGYDFEKLTGIFDEHKPNNARLKFVHGINYYLNFPLADKIVNYLVLKKRVKNKFHNVSDRQI